MMAVIRNAPTANTLGVSLLTRPFSVGPADGRLLEERHAVIIVAKEGLAVGECVVRHVLVEAVTHVQARTHHDEARVRAPRHPTPCPPPARRRLTKCREHLFPLGRAARRLQDSKQQRFRRHVPLVRSTVARTSLIAHSAVDASLSRGVPRLQLAQLLGRSRPCTCTRLLCTLGSKGEGPERERRTLCQRLRRGLALLLLIKLDGPQRCSRCVLEERLVGARLLGPARTQGRKGTHALGERVRDELHHLVGADTCEIHPEIRMRVRCGETRGDAEKMSRGR